jgi:hypothetical protein
MHFLEVQQGQSPRITIPMSAPARLASGPSPSPKALEWCKKIQCIQQEKMTPVQRQQVLQAAERQREILQCQVVSSEVQSRMKKVQVHLPIFFECVFNSFNVSYSLLQAKLVAFFRPPHLLLQVLRQQSRLPMLRRFQEPAAKFHP